MSYTTLPLESSNKIKLNYTKETNIFFPLVLVYNILVFIKKIIKTNWKFGKKVKQNIFSELHYKGVQKVNLYYLYYTQICDSIIVYYARSA